MNDGKYKLCGIINNLASWDHGNTFYSARYGIGHEMRLYTEDQCVSDDPLIFARYDDTKGDIPNFSLDDLFTELSFITRFTLQYVNPDYPVSMDLRGWAGNYIAYTPHMPQGKYPFDPDPEMAMCKLAIIVLEEVNQE